MSAISQRQVQKMLQKLSPQQIQMIKLLELPTLQLEQRIKQEIEENPVLEEESPEEEQEAKEVSVEEYFAEDDTPSYKYRVNNFSKDDEKRPIYLSEGATFHESLIQQLGFKHLNEHDETLAKYLIGSIDDDGYLRRDLRSIADDIAFSLGIETDEHELEKMLKVIHELEPAGVGARNLQECLLLQLQSQSDHTPAQQLATKILTYYFDEFTKKHYEKLISRLGVSEDTFRDAIEEIVRLSPKPGNLYSDGRNEMQPYITPDFILDYHDGIFELSLNGANVPDLKVNRRYVEMIRNMVTKDGKPTSSSDRKKQTGLRQMVHFRHQTASRHVDADHAGDSGLSARVFHRRRSVQTPTDDPQRHCRQDQPGRFNHITCGEQQICTNSIRNHSA